MGRIPGTHEDQYIRLFEKVLGARAQRHHTFPFLRGDPTRKRPDGVALHVDAYFPAARLVVEYMGRQHFENNRLMDRRPGRREQRLRYQKLREDVLPQHGILLIRVRYDEPLNEDLVLEKLIEAGVLKKA